MVLSKVLFVHNSPVRFVIIDKQLLETSFLVQEWYVRSKRISIPATWRAVAQNDVVFCWFASWHSFVPVLFAKILHKPCIVVIGGYDTAYLPEAGYGSQRHLTSRIISRTIIRAADRLITHSQFTREEAIVNTGAPPQHIEVVYPGFEETHPRLTSDRTPSALNVGGIWQENLLRKGLLPFVQAAKYLPEVSFIQVGRWQDESIVILQRAAAKNVTFAGFLSDDALHDLYGTASVYAQPSLHEGFGMSVAEAMLGGCIPVVTRNGALPEVVGETGVYCESNAPEDVASAIGRAFQLDSTCRHKGKDYILSKFPLEQRRIDLQRLIHRELDTGARL